MFVRRTIGELFERANKLAEQYYTPRELKAIVGFLLVGLGVLVVRAGSTLYYSSFPKQRPAAEIAASRSRDSLFLALSAKARTEDSLFFSLPEDSLLPASVRAKNHKHVSKTDGLRPGSISLNHSSKEELTRLPGVGPATAERILAYRAERGRFRKLEELQNVRGFGNTHYERVRRYIRLN